MSAPNSKPARRAAIEPFLGVKGADFKLDGGISVRIHVSESPAPTVCGTLWHVRWPSGKNLAFFCAPLLQVWVDEDRSVWFGSFSLEMPWAELIKLADFLHLDIPQPELPAGQEVLR